MQLQRRSFVGVLGAGLLGACIPSKGDSQSRETRPGAVAALRMLSPRATHAAVLRPRGDVLMIGGFFREGTGLTMVERFDPRRRRFEQFGNLAVPRIQPLALALANGAVLVMGGEWDVERSSAELLLPDGTAKPLPSLADRRTAAAAIALRDNRVLICGGSRPGYKMTASAEIFDPEAGRSSAIAPMAEARAGHRLTMLPDGKVLVTGGGEGGRISASAEIFDPATGRFSPAGSMQQPRYKHAAEALPDGTVLIIGGSDDESGPDRRGRLASCERYDPASGRFVPAPEMHQARYKIGDSVARLDDGTLVVSGGGDRPERLAPAGKAFEIAQAGFDTRRDFMTANAIGAGFVLAAGGYDASIAASDRAWLIEQALWSRS